MSKLVLLDAGHNKYTSGKRSFDSSLLEYEFNIDVRDRLAKHLNRHSDITVQYIDSEKANSSQELVELVTLANKAKGDIYVSIHANAFGTTWNEASGFEVYCNSLTTTTKGYKLAKAIHDNCIASLGIKDRGIKNGSHLYVVKKTTMTSVLIEYGFYTNKAEVAKLKSADFREKCAIATAKGILEYFGIKWVEESATPVATTTTTTENKKLYKVQVGAFSNKTNATKLANELKEKGYQTIIVES